MAELGKEARAVELYEVARQYGFVANSRWFEDVAGSRSAAVAETLPEDEVNTARARGKARDFWETVDEVLQEL